MRFKRWTTVLIVLALGLAGAQAPPRKVSKPPDDAEIERAIRDRLARSKCAADHFTVQVQGGVATFNGRTGVVQRKGAATRIAKSAGARKVVNRIQVSEAAKQKASAGLSKGRRRVHVKRGEARQ